MSAHSHPCDACELTDVPCDLPNADTSIPLKRRPSILRSPRVCERCSVHREAFETDPLFLLLREMVRRFWLRQHDDECRCDPCDFTAAPCGLDRRIDSDSDDCSCGRDANESDAREALGLRIAERTARPETP